MKVLTDIVKPRHLDTVSKDLETFIGQIKSQMEYGGVKYKANKDGKESTDVLFDTFGPNWVIGTICKYVFRLTNVGRSKDALKIATYCYILWLKRGFYVIPSGIDSPALPTNLKVKSDNFELFMEYIRKNFVTFRKETARQRVKELETIKAHLINWSQKEFNTITEQELYDVFMLIASYWMSNFDATDTDTDVWNETNGVKPTK